MQTPGKTELPPPALAIESTTEQTTPPTVEIQIVLQDATRVLLQLLLTTY